MESRRCWTRTAQELCLYSFRVFVSSHFFPLVDLSDSVWSYAFQIKRDNSLFQTLCEILSCLSCLRFNANFWNYMTHWCIIASCYGMDLVPFRTITPHSSSLKVAGGLANLQCILHSYVHTPTCVQFTLIYSMYTVYYCMDCMRRTCHCQGNTTLARSFYSFLPFAAARVSVRRFSKASPSKAYLTSKWLQNIHGLSFPSVREAKMKQKHWASGRNMPYAESCRIICLVRLGMCLEKCGMCHFVPVAASQHSRQWWTRALPSAKPKEYIPSPFSTKLNSSNRYWQTTQMFFFGAFNKVYLCKPGAWIWWNSIGINNSRPPARSKLTMVLLKSQIKPLSWGTSVMNDKDVGQIYALPQAQRRFSRWRQVKLSS